MRRSAMSRRPRNRIRTKSFALKGGLNLIDPPLSIPDGMLLAAINYEALTRGGYRRVDGFERYDGQSKPTNASYWILNFDAGNVSAPVIGSNVQGVTSGAKGEIGSIFLTSGAWDGTGAGYFVVFNVTGSFLDNESLTFTGASDAFGNGFSSGFG